jgi:5-methylthioadenosine/S-adenosylhomocysteine deaminase
MIKHFGPTMSLLPVLAWVALGCGDDGAPGDTDDAGDSSDDGMEDAANPDDEGAEADADADADAEVEADVGGDGPSTRSPPAEVLRTGGPALLLRGVVLAPDGALDPGEVLVGADGLIACVAADCGTDPAAATATLIDTHGTISPGLIDAHNHLAYDFLPEWVPSPPRLFENRYQWANDPAYEAFVAPYANHRSTGTHFCPAAKWGELRALVHGTTTVQGQTLQQSCIDWGVRNAESYHGLGYDHLRTTIGSPRDITDADAAGYIASFDDPVQPVTRLAVHMAEGYANDNVLEEFDSFAGRDPRLNRHAGTSLLYDGTAILIHSVPLTETQLAEVLATDSKIVWSPSSNIVLYGVTAPIQRILQLGITTGIGPDWTPSGEDDMLAELRFARAYGASEGIPEITPQVLWRMASSAGAVVLGLDAALGRLAVGLHADITVFGRLGPDPYAAVIDSGAADVRLVLLDGKGRFGDDGLEAATAVNTYCEPFDACGTAKFICVQDDPAAPNRRNETLVDIRTQLFNILEGIGYPPEEQYHRGAELLELVACPGG